MFSASPCLYSFPLLCQTCLFFFLSFCIGPVLFATPFFTLYFNYVFGPLLHISSSVAPLKRKRAFDRWPILHLLIIIITYVLLNTTQHFIFGPTSFITRDVLISMCCKILLYVPTFVCSTFPQITVGIFLTWSQGP